jgi:hypothetical protein
MPVGLDSLSVDPYDCALTLEEWRRTRGISPPRRPQRGPARERTHCPQGHEYTPENTYVSARGWRYCRACNRERSAIVNRTPERREYMRDWAKRQKAAG